jgi:hypothetical protein
VTLSINGKKIKSVDIPNYSSIDMNENGTKVEITISGKLIDGDVNLNILLPIIIPTNNI